MVSLNGAISTKEKCLLSIWTFQKQVDITIIYPIRPVEKLAL
jgi:hypothetical protein